MVTRLAERVFVSVKIGHQLVIFNIVGQCLDDLTMRQLHRRILVFYCIDFHRFRNILGRVHGA